MGHMPELQGMDSHKRRCRRNSLYNLSYTRLVLSGDKLSRLVDLEPASPRSRESNNLRLRLRPSRRLYPVGSYHSLSHWLNHSRRHLVLSQLERPQRLRKEWALK